MAITDATFPPRRKENSVRCISKNILVVLHSCSEKRWISWRCLFTSADVLEPRGGSTDTAGYPRQPLCSSQAALRLQATLMVLRLDVGTRCNAIELLWVSFFVSVISRQVALDKLLLNLCLQPATIYKSSVSISLRSTSYTVKCSPTHNWRHEPQPISGAHSRFPSKFVEGRRS